MVKPFPPTRLMIFYFCPFVNHFRNYDILIPSDIKQNVATQEPAGDPGDGIRRSDSRSHDSARRSYSTRMDTSLGVAVFKVLADRKIVRTSPDNIESRNDQQNNT